MIVVSKEERDTLIEGGKRLGSILEVVAASVSPGVKTDALNALAERLIRKGGDEPAFLNYKPEGASRPYPAALCVSINDEVVHGIPNENPRSLNTGDIVGLDLGLRHKGLVLDSALTISVGKADKRAAGLMNATAEALLAGISAARPGAYIGDIASAIQEVIEKGNFSVVKILGGHGVGRAVHEEPFVPNAGEPGTGPELVRGMVLALEPIANEGKGSVTLLPDGYTYRTKDGSRSVHFEHTILIEDHGTIILTARPNEVPFPTR